MDNIYLKLEEASRIYLNPTLELVKSGDDLEKHCYYLLKKYPAHDHKFWTVLIQNDFSDIPDLKLDKQLEHNLKMATANNDKEYLDYLQYHRPQKKISLKLVRKEAVIPEDLCKELGILDPTSLTHLRLKRIVNLHIQDNDLQDKHKITIDDVLRKLLKLDQDTKEMHFYEIHRKFNSEFMTA